MKFRNFLIITGLLSMSLVACGSGNGGGSNKGKGKFATSLSISFVGDVNKETGYDAVVEPNKTATLEYTFEPEGADMTTLKWVTSDKDIASCTKLAGTQNAQLNAKGEGDATIYAQVTGKDNAVIKSNELKVKVKGNYKVNADFQKAKTTFMDNGVEKNLTRNHLYQNTDSPHLDSMGENHVLVVPFGFTDENLQSVQSQEMLNRINKTFFGTAEELAKESAWESLASFYEKSSYGNTKFEGKMIPTWVNYGDTSDNFERKVGKGSLGLNAAEYARTWYLNEYAKANHGALGADAEPITYFDRNQDGFLDLVWVVYSRPTGTTEDWWAYVTYSGNRANVSSPLVKTIGFASCDWLLSANNGYNAHTFIHETGHTYGLDDYYDYNNKWAPMGGVDFMDHNMGDHNMYSKFSLGWTAPLVVDEDAVITLHPGTTTGDCFIIPSPGYNNTAFDEYMMFELMAPVGLCEQDYRNGFMNQLGFTEPGIRITHVDARVFKGDHDTYLKNNPQDGNYIRLGNSKGGRSGLKADGDYFPGPNDEKNYMCHLSIFESVIDEETNWTTSSNYGVGNNALFKAGQSFTLAKTRAWAEIFMPSKSNLWNKAKTTTGWVNKDTQTYTIDETCTFNYAVRVLSIEANAEYGWEAKVQVTANAY